MKEMTVGQIGVLQHLEGFPTHACYNGLPAEVMRLLVHLEKLPTGSRCDGPGYIVDYGGPENLAIDAHMIRPITDPDEAQPKNQSISKPVPEDA